jgi:hypothetical protein
MATKQRGTGFQKRLRPEDAKPVGLAVISYSDIGAVCSCGGWSYIHRRRKVLEDAIDRHLTKRHDGRGIRL